jgi:hypothetical protein
MILDHDLVRDKAVITNNNATQRFNYRVSSNACPGANIDFRGRPVTNEAALDTSVTPYRDSAATLPAFYQERTKP